MENFDESVNLNSVLRRADGYHDFRIREKLTLKEWCLKVLWETVKDLE